MNYISISGGYLLLNENALTWFSIFTSMYIDYQQHSVRTATVCNSSIAVPREKWPASGNTILNLGHRSSCTGFSWPAPLRGARDRGWGDRVTIPPSGTERQSRLGGVFQTMLTWGSLHSSMGAGRAFGTCHTFYSFSLLSWFLVCSPFSRLGFLYCFPCLGFLRRFSPFLLFSLSVAWYPHNRAGNCPCLSWHFSFFNCLLSSLSSQTGAVGTQLPAELRSLSINKHFWNQKASKSIMDLKTTLINYRQS